MDYVVLRQPDVEIRTGASTSSIIVAEGSRGEICRCSGEVDGWYKITLFTGDDRFIPKSMAERLDEPGLQPAHHFSLPPSAETLRHMVRSIHREKERARREAETILPNILDEARIRMYRNILEDRYILKVFQNREVHPALYEALLEEGKRRGL
jgi:hypothetical protein